MGECYFDHDNDCANFVSSVLHESGYDFHGTGTASATLADTTKWYSRWSDLYGMVVTTQTWSYADNLYRFLMADYPGRDTCRHPQWLGWPEGQRREYR